MSENERDYGLQNRVETLEMDLRLAGEEIARLEKELAVRKQYTGYLENGMPADEPALECTKCGAYYFHDLGGKSLCGDCLEAGIALLTEARAAMNVFRNPMDVPNTDISESLTIDYVCRKIDAALTGNGEGSA